METLVSPVSSGVRQKIQIVLERIELTLTALLLSFAANAFAFQ